jgi:transposase
MHPTTIGLDLAKHVFQVHGVDAAGKVLIRKKLRRSELKAFFEKLPSCLVGMEACGTAHYWGRELGTLGHDVRLMPAAYVKPYVKRGKNDEWVASSGNVTDEVWKKYIEDQKPEEPDDNFKVV